MSSSFGEVTAWLRRLKGGDRAATEGLWNSYFARLVELARQRLRGLPRRAADEEDVALSAFDSFCRRAAEGRFSRLGDRDDLWQILVMITVRKAADQANHELRQKRGGGAPVSSLGDDAAAAFTELISREPDPAVAAQLAENCRRMLDGLGDESLRAVAAAKMEGDTNVEAARRLGVSLPTVERKLRRIRAAIENQSEL